MKPSGYALNALSFAEIVTIVLSEWCSTLETYAFRSSANDAMLVIRTNKRPINLFILTYD